MARKTMTLEHIDYSLARWKTRLKRAMTAIDKLEKQRKRLVKAQTDLAVAPPTATRPVRRDILQQTGEGDMVIKKVEPPKPYGEVLDEMDHQAKYQPAVEDEIPSFLRRQSPDPIAEQIRKEQAETKKKKAQGRIAKMKAKQSGETKRMPLTGKAALQAIRNG
jgi:ribosomal 50S subunit-associated protein YjgA (DUF615 family)